MPNVLDSSKSALGKLLAAENIRVEHRQVPGPSFDVKNRVLVLPMWRDIDADLYDLMIGHEVGHALYTPADGWVEKVKEHGKNFKTMLNLVEDARIEKKMKRKYPGLRKPMYSGYTQLVNRGFFGVSWDEMNSFPFPDRLNVYFKLGARANVTFNEKEQDLLNRIEAVETWDEVMALAMELYEVSAAEAQDLQTSLDELMESLEKGDLPDGEGDGGEGESFDKMIEDLRKEGKHELADRLENASKKMLDKMQSQLSQSEGGPFSATAKSMEENQHRLVDEKARANYYVSFPNMDYTKWVTPAKVTHQLMNFPDSYEKMRHTLYSDFMSTNKKYISYLVKEFELRRNAAQFAKARTSKTGMLDMDKMWRHRLSEDLFLQTTIVPNGKNHGMVMMIDLSSSMAANMAGTIEQMVTLAMFCRKVNIPFDVYGFSDNGAWASERSLSESIQIADPSNMPWTEYEKKNNKYNAHRNDTTVNSLQISNNAFRLKQLLHHGMKAAEFTHSIQNLLMLAEGFRKSTSYYYNSYSIPHSMELSGTPLNEAILVLRHVANKFKEATKVEVLSTIILTDGDASYGMNYLDNGSERKNIGYDFNYIIEDKNTRHQQKIDGPYNITSALLGMYKHLTDSRVIGFYLMGGSNYKNEIYRRAAYSKQEFTDKQYKEEFGKHRYIGLKDTLGYDVYFMMPGRDLEIDEVNMDKVMTGKGTLLKAFKKMQNTKMVSRVFLNQFIKQVA